MAPIKAPRVENTHPPVSYAFVKGADEEQHRMHTVSFNTVDVHMRTKGDMRGFSTKLHGPSCPSSYRGKFHTSTPLGTLTKLTHGERSLKANEEEKAEWRRKAAYTNHFRRNGGGKSSHAVIVRDMPPSFDMQDMNARSEIVMKTILDSFPRMYFDFVREFMDKTMGPRMKDYLKRRMESLELLITPGTQQFKEGQLTCWKAYYQMTNPYERYCGASSLDLGAGAGGAAGPLAAAAAGVFAAGGPAGRVITLRSVTKNKHIVKPAVVGGAPAAVYSNIDLNLVCDANVFNNLPDFDSPTATCDVFSLKPCVEDHIRSLKQLFLCCDGFANSVTKARLALEFCELQGKEHCDDKMRVFKGKYDFDAVELKVPYNSNPYSHPQHLTDIDEFRDLKKDLSFHGSLEGYFNLGDEPMTPCVETSCVPVGSFMGDFEKVCMHSFSEFMRRNTTILQYDLYGGYVLPSTVELVNNTLSSHDLYAGGNRDHLFPWKWGNIDDPVTFGANAVTHRRLEMKNNAGALNPEKRNANRLRTYLWSRTGCAFDISPRDKVAAGGGALREQANSDFFLTQPKQTEYLDSYIESKPKDVLDVSRSETKSYGAGRGPVAPGPGAPGPGPGAPGPGAPGPGPGAPGPGAPGPGAPPAPAGAGWEGMLVSINPVAGNKDSPMETIKKYAELDFLGGAHRIQLKHGRISHKVKEFLRSYHATDPHPVRFGIPISNISLQYVIGFPDEPIEPAPAGTGTRNMRPFYPHDNSNYPAVAHLTAENLVDVFYNSIESVGAPGGPGPVASQFSNTWTQEYVAKSLAEYYVKGKIPLPEYVDARPRSRVVPGFRNPGAPPAFAADIAFDYRKEEEFLKAYNNRGFINEDDFVNKYCINIANNQTLGSALGGGPMNGAFDTGDHDPTRASGFIGDTTLGGGVRILTGRQFVSMFMLMNPHVNVYDIPRIVYELKNARLEDVETYSDSESRAEAKTYGSDFVSTVPKLRLQENWTPITVTSDDRMDQHTPTIINPGLFAMIHSAAKVWNARRHVNGLDNVRHMRDGNVDKVHYWCETYMESFLFAEEQSAPVANWKLSLQQGIDSTSSARKIRDAGEQTSGFPIHFLGQLSKRSKDDLFPNISHSDPFFKVLSAIRRSSIMWFTCSNYTSTSVHEMKDTKETAVFGTIQANLTGAPAPVTDDLVRKEERAAHQLHSIRPETKHIWVPVAFEQQYNLLKSCGLVETGSLLPKSVWTDEALDMDNVFHCSYHNAKQEYASGVEVSFKDSWNYKHLAIKNARGTPSGQGLVDSEVYPRPFSLCGGTLVQADFLKSINNIFDMETSGSAETNDKKRLMEYARSVINERFGNVGHLPLSMEDTVSPQYLNDMCEAEMKTEVDGLKNALDDHHAVPRNVKPKEAKKFAISSWMAYARTHALIGLASRQRGTELISESRFRENFMRLFITPTFISRKTTDEWAPMCMGVQPSPDGSDHLFSCVSLDKLRDLISVKCSPLAGAICEKNPQMSQAVSLAKDLEENLFSRIDQIKSIQDLWDKVKGRGVASEDFLNYLVDGYQGYINALKSMVLRLMVENNPQLAPLAKQNLHMRPIDLSKVGDAQTRLTTSSFNDPRFDSEDYVEGEDPALSLNQLIGISRSSDDELKRLLSTYKEADTPRVVSVEDQKKALAHIMSAEKASQNADLSASLFHNVLVPSTNMISNYFSGPIVNRDITTTIAMDNTNEKAVGFPAAIAKASGKQHTSSLGMTASQVANAVYQKHLDSRLDLGLLMRGHFEEYGVPAQIQAEVRKLLSKA